MHGLCAASSNSKTPQHLAGSCVPRVAHAEVQTQGLKTDAGVDVCSNGLLVFASARHAKACKILHPNIVLNWLLTT